MVLRAKLEDEICSAMGYKSRIAELEELVETQKQRYFAKATVPLLFAANTNDTIGSWLISLNTQLCIKKSMRCEHLWQSWKINW